MRDPTTIDTRELIVMLADEPGEAAVAALSDSLYGSSYDDLGMMLDCFKSARAINDKLSSLGFEIVPKSGTAKTPVKTRAERPRQRRKSV